MTDNKPFIEVTTTGFPELDEKYERMIEAVGKEKLESIIKAKAKMIADRVRERIPVGPTGNLRSGLEVKNYRRRDHYPVVTQVWMNFKKSPHAYLVEYGTQDERYSTKGRVLVDRNTGQVYGRSVAPMPAHPYFIPVVREYQDRIRQELLNEVKAELERATQ